MTEQDAAADEAESAAASASDTDEKSADSGTDEASTRAAESSAQTDENALEEDIVDEEALDEAELDDELIERVEESDSESIAHELAALRTRAKGLESRLDAREEELDDVTSKLKRKQADFQNYKKRMEKRREQEKQRATENLVEDLLDVRDNLVRALNQDDPSVDDLREGVESTLKGFDDVLEGENVSIIEPEPGADVDPQRHEVLMRVESDQPADTVADVHRPGYVMAEKVLRPAQVTVSDGEN